MAGSVDITGRQYYTFGIGHQSAKPLSAVNAESSAVALQTIGGVQSLVSGDGIPWLLSYARGTLVAALGDSITFQNTNGSALLLRATGYMSWASALSNGLLQFSNALNFGVAGDNTTQVLARVPAAITTMKAASVQYCVVHCGTNDIYASPTITHATTVENLAAIYRALIGAAITPIIVPIIPRAKNATSGSMTTADRQRIQRINNWIRDFAWSSNMVRLADPTIGIVDHSVTNGDPIGALTAATTAYTYDGLHPSPRGAYWMGKAISDALQYDLIGISRRAWSQIDTFDATNNPSGNLLTNGYLTGTAGTAGTGTSGNVASSWTARRQSGTTGAITASKGTVATGNGTTYPTQVLACAAAAGSATEVFQLFQQIFSNFAAGDVVVAECEIGVSAVGAGSLKEVFLLCADDTQNARHLQPETGFYMPDQSWTGVLRTPPLTVGVGATVITTTIQATLDGTVGSNAVTLTIGRVKLAKVA
jgi:lysophospholipase L1-like esterase